MGLALLPTLVGYHGAGGGAAAQGCLGMRSSGFGRLQFLAIPAMCGGWDTAHGNTSTSGRLSSQEGWIAAVIAKQSAGA